VVSTKKRKKEILNKLQYVRNSNRRHRSEAHPHAIASDLVKREAPASLRCTPGSMEGKKETLIFFGTRPLL
jgi:hypothetical protein